MALTELLRNLVLTSPHMRGSDVGIIQKKLGAIQVIDGEYGPITANAVKDWKWRIGLPDKQVNTTLTQDESQYFFGKSRSLAMQARTKVRLRNAQGTLTKRALAVTVMEGWAAKQYKENPAGSNKVPQLQAEAAKQGLAQYYTNMGWAWCAFATTLSGMVAGLDSAKAAKEGKYNWLYCPEILACAKSGKYGMKVVDWGTAGRGDLVLFDWEQDNVADHIGLLREDNNESQLVDTVEGNTSPGNTGSQSNGGGVYLRVRNKRDILAVVRRT